MTIMHQLGDPVAGAAECLCQHHGAAYAEFEGSTNYVGQTPKYTTVADGAAVVSTPITITERCCVCVTAAIMIVQLFNPNEWEIERPMGSIRTTQEDYAAGGQVWLFHHGAWEVLDPGTYTYYLVNRSGASRDPFAAWIKAIASDCEG